MNLKESMLYFSGDISREEEVKLVNESFNGAVNKKKFEDYIASSEGRKMIAKLAKVVMEVHQSNPKLTSGKTMQIVKQKVPELGSSTDVKTEAKHAAYSYVMMLLSGKPIFGRKPIYEFGDRFHPAFIKEDIELDEDD
jgi:hypothetical protein